MLQVENLTKKYHKIPAVDQVSFTVPAGRIGVLLGPNGAGKSTIIKSVAGLLRYEGRIYVDGITAGQIAAKKIFGYVPEIPSMFDSLSAEEHLEYISRAYHLEEGFEGGAPAVGALKTALLERFELMDKKDKLGNELSKGMMQKVSLCCALLIKPKVILMDEPMVGLDPAAIKELKKVFLELRDAGATVLISTHMLDMVKEFWDILYVMEQGKMIAAYDRQVSGNEDIEKLFFELTGGQG